jgi:hypothetical protein
MDPAARPRGGRRGRGGGPGRFAGCLRAAQCNHCESIDCRPRPWLSPLVPGLFNCPRKKKIQQSFSESNAFVCGGPLARGGAPPRRVRRTRPATGRRRAHTVAHGRHESGETAPDAALCCCDGTVGRHLDEARRPGEACGRAAPAVSRAVSRAGRQRWLPARAVLGRCAEAASGGPEPGGYRYRPGMASRPPRHVVSFPPIGGPAAGSRIAGRHIVSPVSRAPRTSADCPSDYTGSHRSDGGARDVRIFAKVQGDSR